MNIAIIGIDPGVTGAAALLKSNPVNFELDVQDLPVTEDTFLKNQSKSLNIPLFADIIEEYIKYGTDYAVLATEQMQGMGFKTPAKTLTMLAEMAGHIEAVVRMVCLYKRVPLFIRKYQPRTWTHWMFPDSGNRKDRKSEAKNESLEKARDLFDLHEGLKLKKHHDRAEALLLAFTALAELQGCVVDPKLASFGNLADVYLSHHQNTPSREAKLTDIFQNIPVSDKKLLNEIKSKLNTNSK